MYSRNVLSEIEDKKRKNVECNFQLYVLKNKKNENKNIKNK